MALALLPEPRLQALKAGIFAPGALANFYAGGSTTARLDTYSDPDGADIHKNANPVVANSAGLFGPIYLLPQAYKLVLTDSAAATIYTQDYISPPTTLSSFQMDLVQLTAQHADLSITNFAGSTTVGMYTIAYYLEVTALDAGAGNLTVDFVFTDAIGLTTQSFVKTLTAVGRASGILEVYNAGGGGVAYRSSASGAYGTSRFNLRMQLLRFN